MALTTTPTRAAETVNTSVASALKDTLLPIRYVHSIAMPTFKLLWANRRRISLGPDKKIRGNFFHGLADAWVAGGGSFEFPTAVKDNLSQLEYSAVRVGSSTSISDEDMDDYRSSSSLYDLAAGRVSEMHGGLTQAMNYLIWSGYGAVTTEVVGNEIDLDTFMSNTPGVKIVGDVGDNSARLHSIPQVIRHDGSGNDHVFGNISTNQASDFWSARVSSYGSVTYGSTSVDATDSIPTTFSNPVSITEKIITDALDEMQIGDDYVVYLACPPKIYSSVVRMLKAQERGTPDNPVASLGITRAIMHPSYNAVLYSEPALADSDMWPNSIWGWDPNQMFLCVIENYEPRVYNWQRIGFSNTLGTAEYVRGNLVCIDRRGTLAIHGVAPV